MDFGRRAVEEYIDDVPDDADGVCAADTGSGCEAQSGGASVLAVVCC